MMNNNGYLILDKPIWYVITCIIIYIPGEFCAKTYNMLYSHVTTYIINSAFCSKKIFK